VALGRYSGANRRQTPPQCPPLSDALDLALSGHIIELQPDPAHEVGTGDRIVFGIEALNVWIHPDGPDD